MGEAPTGAVCRLGLRNARISLLVFVARPTGPPLQKLIVVAVVVREETAFSGVIRELFAQQLPPPVQP